ncbi:MAG: recombination regulator RecX [Bifidobacteriaceae bacterium]|nr:recombination regulator RecX [Bifidobacteriaceae bacterium]
MSELDSKGLFDELGDESFEKAKNSILRMLSFANRSSVYLYDKLIQKGFDADVATRAIDRLCEVKLIDDANFAGEIVNNALIFKKQNRAGIRRELIKHKIPQDLQESALDLVTDEEIEDAISEFIQQKLRSKLKPNVDHEKAIKKVYGQVMRKYGYISDLHARLERMASDVLNSAHTSTLNSAP